MKKICIIWFLCFLLSSPFNAAAEDVNFGWSLGNIWGYYETSQKFGSLDYSLLNFNWLLHDRFIIAFDAIKMHGSPGNSDYFVSTILPTEVGFIPLSFDIGRNHQLCFSINGRIGWQYKTHKKTEEDSHAFFGSIGSEIFIQLRMPNKKMPYSRYAALFVDYTTEKQLKVGLRLDLTSVLLGWLWLNIAE